MVRMISLTRGQHAIVDDADFEKFGHMSWCAVRKGHLWYAQSSMGDKRVYLHRLIMDASKGELVDHIDGDGLNNVRSNLRICTAQQNQRNRTRPQKNNHSGFLGVTPWQGRYRARIKAGGRNIHLGMYATPEEAARARDRAAIELHGEYAATNASLGLLDRNGGDQ